MDILGSSARVEYFLKNFKYLITTLTLYYTMRGLTKNQTSSIVQTLNLSQLQQIQLTQTHLDQILQFLCIIRVASRRESQQIR